MSSPLTVADVHIPRDDRRLLDAHFVFPQASTPGPAVVAIHEIFGLNDHIRRVASRFAEQGYAALAVDLFSGGNRGVCLLRVMSEMMLRPLNNSGLRDLRASIDWLGQRPEVGSYPEKDFTRKAALRLEDELTSRRIPHDIKIYPGARHSFFNEDGKHYDAGAATDAWGRSLAFFAAHLAPPDEPV